MQINNCCQVNIIPQDFWMDLKEPELEKSDVKLKQFDGSLMETRGKFNALLET